MDLAPRRQFLRLLLGGSLFTLGSLVACGQPEPAPRQTGAAGGAQVTPGGPTPIPGTPGTPGGPLPTPTKMPTSIGTVILPTAPTGPYPGSQLRTPETLLTPLPYSTPRPDDPWQVSIAAARTADPKFLAQGSAVVVVGTVAEVRPARWSTPDGRRPANPHDRQSPYYIGTPVFVQIEQVVKGVPPTTQLLVLAPEGMVGNEFIQRNDRLFVFQPGQRVVLFLNPREREPLQLDGQSLWDPTERYTVAGDQGVTNPYQTTPIPLQQLLDIVRSVSSPQPTPVATPQRP